jgi:glycosyltransferase involved in cell wall biosynthesis
MQTKLPFMAKKHSKLSVIIVQRLVPYYRLPFFQLLTSVNPDLEIKVYHGDKTLANAGSLGFNSQYYVNYTLKPFGFTLVCQPRLMLHVLLARPDILVIEGTFGVITNFILLLLRWIVGSPTLIWTAGWQNPEITGWRLWLKDLFIRASLLFSTGAIVYGSAALQYLVAHGLSEEKIIVAQNTIDVESVISEYGYWVEQGKLVRQKYNLHTPFVISYVGHLSPMKRVNILLEAFFILRTKRDDIALLIVGKGEQEPELRKFVNSKNLPNIYFIGEVIDGVEAFFAASDLFVLPGTGGLALNQAMALALPVLATVADGTQVDLIFPGENGYLVPVDDAHALATAIENALSSSSHLKSLGQNSLRIVKNKATLTNMVNQYSHALRKNLLTYISKE